MRVADKSVRPVFRYSAEQMFGDFEELLSLSRHLLERARAGLPIHCAVIHYVAMTKAAFGAGFLSRRTLR